VLPFAVISWRDVGVWLGLGSEHGQIHFTA